MTDKHEALIFADDRRTSSGDDLYEWSIDAEDWIRRLHAENTTLQQGYAAARLEIESLRAAQSAAQPGAAYAALSDAPLSVFSKGPWTFKETGQNFSGAELDEAAFVAYRDRASHGQAPAPINLNCKSEQKRLATLWGFVLAQAAPAYKDSTPELHIGDSAFESWYSSYNPTHKGDKQRARDAYAAGMGDPLVIATPAAQPAPQQEAQEPCPTCIALASTVMLDQVSFDRKPDCYGIRQITDDAGVEEWEDIRTSPDVAREEANDMMATGRGEIYEVVPLWTTPQPTQAQAEPKSGAKSFQTYGEANAYSKGYYAGKKAATQAQAQAGAVPLTPREVELIDGMIAVQLDHATRCDAIANRAMADKQKGWDMERVALLQKLKASHGIKGVQHGTDTRSN